jgi:hypothetical protein
MRLAQHQRGSEQAGACGTREGHRSAGAGAVIGFLPGAGTTWSRKERVTGGGDTDFHVAKQRWPQPPAALELALLALNSRSLVMIVLEKKCSGTERRRLVASSGEMAAPASPKGEGRIHDVVVLRRPPRPCELGSRAEHG